MMLNFRNGGAFSSLLAHDLGDGRLSEGDATRRVFADIVSANYFTTFTECPFFPGTAVHGRGRTACLAIPVVIVSYSDLEENRR